MGLKVAVIGAGSTYTPELFDGFIKRRDELPVSHFCLMDIDENKMHIVGALAKRMLDKNNMDCKFEMTTDLDYAIKDCDFVITQVRVGKLEARYKDETIPLKYDFIGQETTGIGGMFKALRTIPVIMNVAERMKVLCPDAWLINFANPSGIMAETILNNTDIKMMGLCNAPIFTKKNVREVMVPETAKDVYIEYLGLNHLTWVTGVYCDGVDILPEKLVDNVSVGNMKNIGQIDMDPQLTKSIGCILGSSYLTYYYYRDKQLNKLKSAEKCRAEVCMEIEKELLEMYKDTSVVSKPAALDKRGGAMYSEAAVSLISAIYNDKQEEHTVDVQNNGTFDFMDDTDVVEVNCIIGKDGAKPIKPKKELDQHIKTLMRTVKCYERHTVLAGLNGDYEEAMKALLIHPLIGDFEKGKACFDELLEAHKEHLPKFFK